MKEISLLEMNENDKEPEYESDKHNYTYQAIQSMSYMVKKFRGFTINKKLQEKYKFEKFNQTFHRISLSFPMLTREE